MKWMIRIYDNITLYNRRNLLILSLDYREIPIYYCILASIPHPVSTVKILGRNAKKVEIRNVLDHTWRTPLARVYKQCENH